MATSLTQAASVIAAASKGEYRAENLPAPAREGSHLLDALFQGQSHVRFEVDENNKPWFFAKDVCEILEIVNVSQACTAIKVAHKGISSTYTLGGTQAMTTVDVPGLFKLIFKSRSARAEAFQDWVYEEVLPSIAMTGSYIDKQRIAALENANAELGGSVECITSLFGSDETFMKMAHDMDAQRDTIKSLCREISSVEAKCEHLTKKNGPAFNDAVDRVLRQQRKMMNDKLRKTRDHFKEIRRVLKQFPYKYEPTLRSELASIEDIIERVAVGGE